MRENCYQLQFRLRLGHHPTLIISTSRTINRKSTSGACQFLGRSLVSWSSKKQNCISLSTAEAEYVAAASAGTQLVGMRQTLKEYGVNCDKVPLLYDNESAIKIAYNPVQHSRTKHIEIRHHFIRGFIILALVPLRTRRAFHIRNSSYLAIIRKFSVMPECSQLLDSDRMEQLMYVLKICVCKVQEISSLVFCSNKFSLCNARSSLFCR